MERRTVGRYRILGKIGAGGMGEVWCARDESLDRDVALKVLPAAMSGDVERRQRFEREAKTLASLQHPNIVTIHSIEEDDGLHFLTMELVKGQTLDALIDKNGLPLDRLFELAMPLADAVHAAHERGVIHRDLKPGNVMVDDTGRLRVLDFGLAKPAGVTEQHQGTTHVQDEAPTEEGQILGTVSYMSPEQAEGKPLDRRSDIFSLGVLLYEMATGQRPFQGSTKISTMSAILKETPPSVISLKPLPRHLGRIIQRCLEKNPDRRFQTARDVSIELEGLKREVESGEVDLVSSSSGSNLSVARLTTPVTRSRRRAWTAVAGLAVVAVAVVVWSLLSGEPEPGIMPQLRTRPLTGAVGYENVGSWSPDGSFFAFSHCANGPMDIFIQSTAGGDPIRLVTSPADELLPAWSPDNRWIAFISGRGGRVGIYLVPPLGGEERLLVETGLAPLGDEDAVALSTNPWSPDGQRLCFSRRNGERIAVWTVDLGNGAEVQLSKPGAGQNDLSPVWSQDGTRIAFMRDATEGTTLWVVPASGGEERLVPVEGEVPVGLDLNWSPDGQHLVTGFVVEGAADNLWSVNVSSGERRQLTFGTVDLRGVAVGRDGRILYNDFSHQTDLYLLNLDSRDQRRLTFHTQSNFNARISPDGTRVVYDSDRTGNTEIWLLDMTTGKERQLTLHEAADDEPCWSPDGRRIAFKSDRTGSRRIWVVDASGGAARPLGEHEGARTPHWSPDGEGIGFLSGGESGSALWLAPVDGGPARKLREGVRDFCWYRDGRRVIYTPIKPGTEIRAADLSTGQTTLLIDAPHLELAVDPGGMGLTYCSAESHFNMNLMLMRLVEGDDGLPRATGPPEPLTAGDGLWHVHNGGWYPDGRQVVYTRDTDTGDVHMLEGVF